MVGVKLAASYVVYEFCSKAIKEVEDTIVAVRLETT